LCKRRNSVPNLREVNYDPVAAAEGHTLAMPLSGRTRRSTGRAEIHALDSATHYRVAATPSDHRRAQLAVTRGKIK
jgi:hypothetical protein